MFITASFVAENIEYNVGTVSLMAALLMSQSLIVSRTVPSFSSITSTFLFDTNMAVSSAYSKIVSSMAPAMSLTLIRNNKGPRMNSCGTLMSCTFNVCFMCHVFIKMNYYYYYYYQSRTSIFIQGLIPLNWLRQLRLIAYTHLLLL